MKRKDLEAAARKLDHLGMDALWKENTKLKDEITDLWWALEHATDHMEPDDDCEECKQISKLHAKYRRGM